MQAVTVRGLRYTTRGPPASVLCNFEEVLDEQSLAKDQVLVEWLASPINPSDINQIEGSYAVLPELPAIPGNEGVGRVIAGNEFDYDQLVVPRLPGIGTWRTHSIVNRTSLFEIRKDLPLYDAATLTVNPPTAMLLLRYLQTTPKCVVQNAGSSAVGEAVIQIAKHRGIKTLTVLRDRSDEHNIAAKKRVLDLGGDAVCTESELQEHKFLGVTEGMLEKPMLALNAVGGRSATGLISCLDQGGTMVTYGGMSRKPILLGTASLIFKDIHLCGFWLTRWKQVSTEQEWDHLLSEISELVASGDLRGRYVPSSLSSWKTQIDRVYSGGNAGKLIFDMTL